MSDVIALIFDFDDPLASEFAYGDDGGIEFLLCIVSFTDNKTRYLFDIQKGIIGLDFRSKPFEVNRKVPEDRLRMPFDQIDPKHRDKCSWVWGGIGQERISNLNQTLHDEQAEFYQWLEEAVTSSASRITLNSRVHYG